MHLHWFFHLSLLCFGFMSLVSHGFGACHIQRNYSTITMKKLVITASIGLLLILTGYGVFKHLEGLSSPERRAWKEKTIAEIAARVADPKWPASAFAKLKPMKPDELDIHESWLTDHIIVTRNGEWLAYANVCAKEKSGIRDLFLAKGSDGRWYYSTEHFCVGMITLKFPGIEQPENLADFANRYYLRSFDGQSDDCLQKTRP